VSYEMDDAERSRVAQEKMDRGELPRVEPKHIWVQTGTWEPCALCDVVIGGSETGYELQFTLRLVSFWFHPACYTTWRTERSRP